MMQCYNYMYKRNDYIASTRIRLIINSHVCTQVNSKCYKLAITNATVLKYKGNARVEMYTW